MSSPSTAWLAESLIAESGSSSSNLEPEKLLRLGMTQRQLYPIITLDSINTIFYFQKGFRYVITKGTGIPFLFYYVQH